MTNYSPPTPKFEADLATHLYQRVQPAPRAARGRGLAIGGTALGVGAVLAAIVTMVATMATTTATTAVRRSLARRDVLMCRPTMARRP